MIIDNADPGPIGSLEIFPPGIFEDAIDARIYRDCRDRVGCVKRIGHVPTFGIGIFENGVLKINMLGQMLMEADEVDRLAKDI